ncbi:hypothetical protein GRI44_02560 [Altererythrobacter confluentis]|uniref:Uncharacterized protein n=1 Tax=Allopontixanthobacter confluentis TaxID=1849021 RepID=A0A6L7GDR7_9SPHN|nr:hypothetical protein [Allopontixanthobacter confluentis]MXP13635.1 hypothetical protein [Allopontixanthobacter confluentis]
MEIIGYILLGLGLVIAFGNLTGGGLDRPSMANGRLVFAIMIAAIGAWLLWG